MTVVRPRRLVHHGTVQAAGLLFEPRMLGEGEARRRVMELWKPGAAVYRVDGDLVLWLAAPLAVRCDRSPGTPLLPVGVRSLTAVPLQADELQAVAPAPGTLLRARGGEVAAARLDEASREDPAQWLEVGDLRVVETTSLGAPPPQVELLLESEEFDPRSRLKAPPAVAEAQEVLASLRRAGAAMRGPGSAPAVGARFALGAIARAAADGTGWLAARLRGAFKDATPGSYGDASPFGPAPPRRRGEPNRLTVFAHQALARLLMLTRVSQAIGRRQAQYLERMLEMFERSDLTEALRHAIPLGGGLNLGSRLPALGTPSPRDALRIQPHEAGGSSSICVADELMDMLRKVYRSAFERLEAAGRIDEAAFVLAELLHANEEAVAFLERHGRLRLAAELAEARELEPALVVRQWFLAGDRERAVLFARRTGAFAAAVTRLEASHPELAAELRELWAKQLAEAGDFTGAVDAVWPLADRRFLAREWVDQAIQCGGPTGGRMLARKLSLFPEALGEVRAQVLELLDHADPDAAPVRVAFGTWLAEGARTPGIAALGRATARALARDSEDSTDPDLRRAFTRLVSRFGDGGLRADAPQLPAADPVPNLRESGAPPVIEVAAEDVGTLPVYDAALLPNGRALVALGEAGVRLLTRDGRTVAHFPQPAHHLVLSDHGDRAIALARRGEAYRLARLNLVSFQSESWCEARLTAFAPDYDGSLWCVGAPEDGFLLIDATAPRWSAVWRMRELEGTVRQVRRSEAECTLLIRGDGVQRWTYSLPGAVLRYRREVPVPQEEVVEAVHGVSPEGQVLALTLRKADMGDPSECHASVQIVGSTEALAVGMASPTEDPLAALMGTPARRRAIPFPAGEGAFWVVPVRRGDELACLLLESGPRERLEVRARIRLHGATEMAVRLQEHHWTVCDDRGRFLVVDVRTGVVLRNARVS